MSDFPPFHTERVFQGPGLAETLYLGTCDGQRVIRKMSNPDAFDFSKTALIREINYLRSLPDELRTRFISLIRTNLPEDVTETLSVNGVIWYDMPYCSPEDGWCTLSSLLLDGFPERRESEQVMKDIAEASFLLFTVDNRVPSDDYVEDTMLESIRESLDWTCRKDVFSSLMHYDTIAVNGKTYRNIPVLMKGIEKNTPESLLSVFPKHDRLLHGDFFPENIIYNTNRCELLLLDPVSVRGVYRGDFILDTDKMDTWLSGELPALRQGLFDVSFQGNVIECNIHRTDNRLKNLAELGVCEYYRELMKSRMFADIFQEESGWALRREFIRAFYALSILPLADVRQALVRYSLAVIALNNFYEMSGLEDF